MDSISFTFIILIITFCFTLFFIIKNKHMFFASFQNCNEKNNLLNEENESDSELEHDDDDDDDRLLVNSENVVLISSL